VWLTFATTWRPRRPIAPRFCVDGIDPVGSAGRSAIAKSRNTGQVRVSPTRYFIEDVIDRRLTAMESVGRRCGRPKVSASLPLGYV
jgi:hypothetical protein